MPERRDHGFLYDIAEAFKRDLNYEYRGLERGFAEGLSLALAEAFLHGSRPPQELRQAITNELLRKGWATNIAGAVAPGSAGFRSDRPRPPSSPGREGTVRAAGGYRPAIWKAW